MGLLLFYSKLSETYWSNLVFRFFFNFIYTYFTRGVGVEKCPQPQGATKLYPYIPNRRAGNDSPMCALHCPGVRLMHTSKIREIIRDLSPLCMRRMWKNGKVRVTELFLRLSSPDYTKFHSSSLWLSERFVIQAIFLSQLLVFLKKNSWIILFNIH